MKSEGQVETLAGTNARMKKYEEELFREDPDLKARLDKIREDRWAANRASLSGFLGRKGK